MTGENEPFKPLSVSAMARVLGFSRQHFHVLVRQGIFSAPVYHVTSRRPMYVGALQERCFQVLRYGIGANGQSVMFNNTCRRREDQDQTKKRSSPTKRPTDARVRRLVDQLAYLSVRTTVEQVSRELRAARAQGIEGDGPELLGHLVRRLGGNAPDPTGNDHG